MNPEAAIDSLVQFYEQLTPGSLSVLDSLYAPRARFKDPFNEVRGVDAIRTVLAHMFDTLDGPRFVVQRRVQQGRECFLVWEFQFRFRGAEPKQTVRGVTHVLLDRHGRVLLHRDYWDAAEEMYEKLPLLGSLMRWLKRRLRAH